MAGGYAPHDPTSGGFDVAGMRAMGYYTADDLPFYYWAATTFATSDRWFSPALTRTQPNRMYLLAATSNGYAYPGGTGDTTHPALNMGNVKSIFQLLQENNITWKVYVTDNYVAGDLRRWILTKTIFRGHTAMPIILRMPKHLRPMPPTELFPRLL